MIRVAETTADRQNVRIIRLPRSSGGLLQSQTEDARLCSFTLRSAIIRAMGRMRIKKKDAVIPFRQTMAYRLLLAVGSLVLLLFTVYFLTTYLRSGNTTGTIISAAAAVMAVTSLLYNLGEVRNARVPASTLKRASRRR